MDTKKFIFSIRKFDIQQTDNPDFFKLGIYAISDGVNRNDSEFTLESMKEALSSFKDKPVLAYYNPKTDNVEAHNTDYKYDFFTDDIVEDYTGSDCERPIGLISQNDIVEIRQYGNKNWIYFTCAIWAKYNAPIVELLQQKKRIKVSVEVSITQYQTVNDIEIIDAFIFDGVTLLGNQRGTTVPVEEGIEGANASVLNFTKSDKFNQFKTALNFAYNHQKENSISIEGGENDMFGGMTLSEFNHAVYSALSSYTFMDGDYECNLYYLDDATDTLLIVHNIQDENLYQIPYVVNDYNTISLDMSQIKQVEINYTPKTFAVKTKIFLAKDQWGTGDALKVDESKDSVSNSAWGDVNKTSLMNAVLKASNYKTLINDVYMYVGSDWETSPTGENGLKYPVMQLKDDTLVYNSGGLSSALGYATAQKETEVVNKIKKIQKKLGLDKDNKKEVNSLDKEKINSYSFQDYVCFGYDDKNAYFLKDGKVFSHDISEEKFTDEGMGEFDFSDGAMTDMFADGMFIVADSFKCAKSKADEEKEKMSKDFEAVKAELEAVKAEKEDLSTKLTQAEDELRMAKEEKATADKAKLCEDIDGELDDNDIDEDFAKEVKEKADKGEFESFEKAKEFIAVYVYNKNKEKKAKQFSYSVGNDKGIPANEENVFESLAKTTKIKAN